MPLAAPVSVLPDQKHSLHQKDPPEAPGGNTYGIRPNFFSPDGNTALLSVHNIYLNLHCKNNCILHLLNIRIYRRDNPPVHRGLYQTQI